MVGTQDFIEYWTSYQLFSAGADPYDPKAMLELQLRLQPDLQTPLMMWSPPWIFFFMRPVLGFDFLPAARLWLICNFAFLFAAILFSWHVWRKKDLLLAVGSGCLFLLPVAQTLSLGQLSLLLAVSAAGLYWSLVREKDIWSGIFCAVLTLKPHLFHLVALVLFWWIVRHRRFRIPIAFVLTMAALVLWCTIAAPDSLRYWTESMSHPPAGSIRTLDWVVATLVGAVRMTINWFTGTFPPWPMVVVPGVTAIIVFSYCIRSRGRVDWKIIYPPLLALSLFTSPYGWVFDATCLLPAHLSTVALICSAGLSRGRVALFLSALGAAHFVTFLLAGRVLVNHGWFFYVPAMVLLFWLYAYRAWRLAQTGAEAAVAPM